MSTNPPFSKRTKYDLDSPFDVLVGNAESRKRFTLHTDVFIPRSEFFRAARSSQWLSDPQKPVDLEDESANHFSLYMNCVYFGIEVLRVEALEADEEGFERSEDECRKISIQSFEDSPQREVRAADQIETLVKVYLLADKLHDRATANAAIDEIVRFGEEEHMNPAPTAVALAYGSTAHGNPLRKLMRDYYVYEYPTAERFDLYADELPKEFYRDVVVEYMRRKDGNLSRSVDDVYHALMVDDQCAKDSCHYHQHDDKHPRCTPESGAR